MTRFINRAILLAAVCVCCTALTPAAHANLLTDGGFESYAGPTAVLPLTPPATLPGWTASGSGMAIESNGFPHTGTNDVAFTATSSVSTGTLSQTVTTLVGQAYTLSFWLLDPNFIPGSETLNVTFGGFTTSVAPTTPGASYANVALTILGSDVTSTTTTLSFQGVLDTSTFAPVLYLDDVSLTANAVPEPSSLAVFAAMLCLLAPVGLRRSSRRH